MPIVLPDQTTIGFGACADGQALKRVGTAFVGYTPEAGGAQFPVGWVAITVVNTNPGTSLGYGTWVALGAGRVLVGVDAADPAIDAPKKVTGAKTVAAAGTVGSIGTPVGTAQKIGTGTAAAAISSHTHNAPTFTGTPTSVVQPSIAVYFWERTA